MIYLFDSGHIGALSYIARFLSVTKLQVTIMFYNHMIQQKQMSITRSESKSQLVQTAFELQQETIIMLICCRFVCGQRVGDWPLALRAWNELCPWFFAFGHTNYARWLPIFLRDILRLSENNHSVHQEFVHRKSSFIVGTESFL